MAVEKWLEEAVQTLRNHNPQQWEVMYDNTPPHHFVLQTEKCDGFLIGSLFFSADKGGRRYPLTLFIEVNAPEQLRDMILAPVAFAQFFKETTSLMKERGHLQSEAFLAGVERLGCSPADRQSAKGAFSTFLRNTTNETFWTANFGDFNDSRKFLLLQNLTQILFPLQQQKVQRFSLGLRFPLPADGGENPLWVTFWLFLINRLLGKDFLASSAFWTTENSGTAPGVLVFLQPPAPGSLRFVIQPESDDNRLCVLARDGEANPALFLEASRQAIGSPNLPLADLITCLSAQDGAKRNGDEATTETAMNKNN